MVPEVAGSIPVAHPRKYAESGINPGYTAPVDASDIRRYSCCCSTQRAEVLARCSCLRKLQKYPQPSGTGATLFDSFGFGGCEK